MNYYIVNEFFFIIINVGNAYIRSLPMKQTKMHRKEIQHIFNTGTSVANPYLKIFYTTNQHEFTRYAIAIKKEFGNAVMRNKAKRHIRELYHVHQKEIKQGFDLVFFIKNEFGQLTFKEKDKCFLELFKKL